jgi:squalene synthase HpnC
LATGISSIEHYENFPVASRLVPARLRPAIAAVYWFARSADDLADEGDARTEERLKALEQYREALLQCSEFNGASFTLLALTPDVQQGFERLSRVIGQHGLRLHPFEQLLSAFRQDAAFEALANEEQLLNYCERSANPVGRIMLQLFDVAHESLFPAADAICTSLQLINFLQDMRPDAQRARVYIPLASMQEAGLSQQEWTDVLGAARPKAPSSDWLERAQMLVRSEHARAQALLHRGMNLPQMLRLASFASKNPKDIQRLALELRATIAGGQCILDKISRTNFNPLAPRPRIPFSLAHDSRRVLPAKIRSQRIQFLLQFFVFTAATSPRHHGAIRFLS